MGTRSRARISNVIGISIVVLCLIIWSYRSFLSSSNTTIRVYDSTPFNSYQNYQISIDNEVIYLDSLSSPDEANRYEGKQKQARIKPGFHTICIDYSEINLNFCRKLIWIKPCTIIIELTELETINHTSDQNELFTIRYKYIPIYRYD